MSEPFQFDYYYGAESDQFSFIRIPKLLLKDPKFLDLSYGAIITYAVLLDRMNLSIKNGWHDEMNRVYIRYKVADLMDVIGKTDDTVSKYLKELEDIGLIERPRKGLGKGKVTYVKNFISPDLRDGNLITRENAGNGSGEIIADDSNNTVIVDNSSKNGVPEAAKIHITRDSSGNVPRENSGNVYRDPSGNVTRENAGNDKSNIEINNNYINNNYLNQNHITATGNPAGSDDDEDWITYREIIKDNIEFDILCTREGGRNREEIEGIVDIMTEAMVSKSKTMWIAKEEYPTNLVKGKLMKINATHIEYILDCFHANTSKIYNIKKYLLAAIFNAPSTIDSYYRAEVNHDLHGMY